MIKAVFLDFYHTLYFHEHGSFQTSVAAIAARYGVAVNWDRYAAAARSLFRDTGVSGLGTGLPTEPLLQQVMRVMHRECAFIRELGIQEHVEQIAWELLQSGHPLFAPPPGELYADVVPTLQRLRGEGFKLAIVSNWDTPLGPLVEWLGITEYFDAIVASHDARVRSEKPDPHIFNYALAAVGVSPAEAVHVGDTYGADVVGARHVGIRPILLDRDGEQAGIWKETIRSLSELSFA